MLLRPSCHPSIFRLLPSPPHGRPWWFIPQSLPDPSIFSTVTLVILFSPSANLVPILFEAGRAYSLPDLSGRDRASRARARRLPGLAHIITSFHRSRLLGFCPGETAPCQSMSGPSSPSRMSAPHLPPGARIHTRKRSRHLRVPAIRTHDAHSHHQNRSVEGRRGPSMPRPTYHRRRSPAGRATSRFPVQGTAPATRRTSTGLAARGSARSPAAAARCSRSMQPPRGRVMVFTKEDNCVRHIRSQHPRRGGHPLLLQTR